MDDVDTAILDLRAERLAARRDQAAVPSASIPILVFGLGKDRYAFALCDLSETTPLIGCVTVPGAPPDFLGVANVRGRIRAVVELSRLLGSDRGPDAPDGYLLLTRARGQEIGFRVDRIEEARDVPEGELIRYDGSIGGLPSGYVLGVTPDLVVILAAAPILSSLVKWCPR